MEDFDLVSLGIPKERTQLFQEEINEHKNDTQFFVSLGDGLIKKQKYQEAIQCYERALAIDPSVAEVWNNLGVAYISADKLVEAAKSFEQAVQKVPEFYMAYFNLGLLYLKASRLSEAQKCHEKVIKLSPNHFGAHLSLGSIYGLKAEKEKALEHYEKAIAIDPKHAGAQHMIRALQGVTTKRAPAQYVEELFDSYSKRFEEHLTMKLKYKVPEIIADEILSHGVISRNFESVLDLGCGTGLMATALKKHYVNIKGVDLSGRMIALAEEKKLYQEIIKKDVNDFLSETEETFDLITAADVFVYYGELRELFKLIEARLRPEGLFAFSIESLEGEGYVLRESGRFAHSVKYIEGLSEKLVVIRHLEKINLRMDNAQFLTGSVFLMGKKEKWNGDFRCKTQVECHEAL